MARIGEKILSNPPVKLERGESYPLIDIDKITPGLRYVTNESEVVYSGQSGAKFENGDTLMARITPCLENGKVASCRIPDKGIGSTELFVFRGIPCVTDNDYVFYLMSSKYIRQLAANSMTGASGRQRADLNFLKKIKWDFPAFEEQRRIASVLSKYDSLIDNYLEQISLLRRAANQLYKEWFIRFRYPNSPTEVGTSFKLPVDWNCDKVLNFVDRLPFNKIYKPFELVEEGTVVVVDQSEKECLGYHNNEPSHKATVDSPICLFGDHSCKFQMMIKDFSLGENVVPFKAKGNNSTYYLFFATKDIIRTEEYKRHWGAFMSKKIIMPSPDLQMQFERIIKPYFKQIENLNAQILLLKKQRDLLLPRLISGAVKV